MCRRHPPLSFSYALARIKKVEMKDKERADLMRIFFLSKMISVKIKKEKKMISVNLANVIFQHKLYLVLNS
jgi:hypothetical protein